MKRSAALLFRFGPPYDEISHKLIFKQGPGNDPETGQVDDGEVCRTVAHEEFLRSIEDEFWSNGVQPANMMC